MNRTRTLVIVGCFMFALAVLAAFELREEVQISSEGQMVTGALSSEVPADRAIAKPTFEVAPDLVSGTTNGERKGSSEGLSAEEPTAVAEAAPQADLAPAIPMATTSKKVPSAQERQPGPTPVVNQPEPLSISHRSTERSTTATKEPEAPRADAVGPAQVKVEPVKAKPDAKAEVPQKGSTKVEPGKKEEPKKEESKQSPSVKTEGTASETEVGKAKNAATAAAKNGTKVLSTAAPNKLEPGEKAIVWTRLEVTPQSVVFRLTGAAALEGKAFVLPEPDRYVVDLQGFWGIVLPKVPENAQVKALREGRQGNNTRLVFDLKKAPGAVQIVRINPETLEIRIR